MKKHIFFTVIIVLFLAINSFSQQQSPYYSDIQMWNTVQITVPIFKGKDSKDKPFDKVAVVFDGIARLGRNVTYPVDTRFSTTLDFRINKYLKFSPGYLYQRSEIVPRIKNYESRLTLAGNFEKKFANFTFKHRSMFEYKFRNSRSNTQVYRSRYQISHPVKFHEKEIFSPFISEEPFYEFTNKVWNRNEFFAGISRRITKSLVMDFFYINQWAKTGLPHTVNGFGISFKVRID